MQLNTGFVSKALSLPSSKDYCVSAFEPSVLYGGRPTYVYGTAIRSLDDSGRPVGVIQIVFDSEPQFLDMLLAVLPRDENKGIQKGSFGVFTDRGKKVISSTSAAYAPGDLLPLPDTLFHGEQGERQSSVVELDGRYYTVGQQVSAEVPRVQMQRRLCKRRHLSDFHTNIAQSKQNNKKRAGCRCSRPVCLVAMMASGYSPRSMPSARLQARQGAVPSPELPWFQTVRG